MVIEVLSVSFKQLCRQLLQSADRLFTFSDFKWASMDKKRSLGAKYNDYRAKLHKHNSVYKK